MALVTRITLSKTEIEQGPDGKWYFKELSRETFGEPAEKTRLPSYWPRFLELRREGLTYFEIAKKMTAEGYRAKQGGDIQPNTLAVQYGYHSKAGA